jgi:hypothetical protein
MKFLEHSQKEEQPLLHSQGLLHDRGATEIANSSALVDASAEGDNSMNVKSDSKNEGIEDPPSFFDELHARLAPSRSLKRHFLEEEVIDR